MIFKRLMMLILFFICGYSGYYLLIQKDSKEKQQVKSNTEKPLFTAEHVESTNYDEEGIRSYALESVYLEHYIDVDETHFNDPVLWTYRDGIAQEWRITSKFAVLKNSRMMTMTGDVKIFNLLPDTQIKTITTQELTLDLSTRDFWSKTKTNILGVGFTSEGKTMKGNFGSHQMELIKEVMSKYESFKK